MTSADPLQHGRDRFARRAWADALAALSAAQRIAPLEPEDLERLAAAAYLCGRDAESVDAWTRAHDALRRRGDSARAARCAFWLAFTLLDAGEPARGLGWVARARRLLGDERDCVERGYLLYPLGLRSILAGDADGACATFREAVEIGERFGDTDLVALARQGEGRALIRLGRAAEGMALLDEVMLSVTLGEASPLLAGDVYCSLIEACHEVYDLHRAREWTAALSRWCESQPDLVPHRGQCLVRRAELLRLHGDWRQAMDEARRARERLADPPGQPAIGAAYYQQAELHRLRGELSEAEDAYREAARWGRTPRPGLALLRLAQGRLEAARAMIRRLLDEATEQRHRSALLPACVEIMLAVRDVPAARTAADELAAIAAELGALLLRAESARATGAVLMAEGDAAGALAALRDACAAWQELDVPYEAARTRELVALACRALGDQDAAAMELDAARQTLRRLGATAALARIGALALAPRDDDASPLTARELQVLRCVAAGRTNRTIAGDLAISERTVAHHVSSILGKLGLPTRAAATAYAYEHGLV